MKSRIGQVMSFVGESLTWRPVGEDFEHGSAEGCGKSEFAGKEPVQLLLTASAAERKKFW
jgi:hypothetical protein